VRVKSGCDDLDSRRSTAGLSSLHMTYNISSMLCLCMKLESAMIECVGCLTTELQTRIHHGTCASSCQLAGSCMDQCVWVTQNKILLLHTKDNRNGLPPGTLVEVVPG
jgi:hypothetical protein